jgi:Tfp pilus assembly protein PilN
MFEAQNQKEALNHIVHITYGNESEGSGVIVPNKEYSYVLTAKHTFGKDEKERGDDYDRIQKSNIELEKITLVTSSKIKLSVLDILIIESEPQLDFLIIKIENSSDIDSLKQLDIYEEDFNYCLPYGYPESTKEEGHTSYEPFNCEHKPINSSDKLEIRIIDYMSVKAKQGTNSYMSGISGAGVFVENYDKDTIYLVGIVIQGTDTITQNLVCLDLEKISKKINNFLESEKLETLKISGAQWKNKFGFDMSDLDFEKEIEEFKQKSKNKFIKALKDQPLYKFVDKFDNEVKSNLKKEEENFQKISESYLYIGMNFHQLQAHKRATHYFNKAIEYGGDKNRSYLLDAKSKREEEKTLAQKSEQEKELMLGFINSLYQDMYEYEEQLEKDSEDESTKKKLLECYKELIEKLNFFDDRNDEILDIHNKSIKLYADFNEYDNIQEQIVELKDMIDLSSQVTNMEKQIDDYQKKIETLTQHIQLLSTHIPDKTLLNKINFKVYSSDKKLDNLSTNLAQKIDFRANQIDKKLDTITILVRQTNNKKIDIFLDNIYKSNKALVAKLQMIYHQNNKANNQVYKTFNKFIKEINSRLNNVADFNENTITEVKTIVEQSNWDFYKKIVSLYDKNLDSYHSKLLQTSIELSQKEYYQHIEDLKKSYQMQNLRIKDIYEKEVLNLQKTITAKEQEVQELSEWLYSINLKYERSNIDSKEVEKQKNELEMMNKALQEKVDSSAHECIDLEELAEYKEKIKILEKLIEQLRCENEEIGNLKSTIEKSNETSKNLLQLQLQYQEQFVKTLTQIKSQYERINQNQNVGGVFEEHLHLIEDKFSDLESHTLENFLDKNDFNEMMHQLEKIEEILSEIEEYSSQELKPSISRSLRISENLKGINSSYKENLKEYKKEIEELLEEVREKLKIKKTHKFLLKHFQVVEERWNNIDDKDINVQKDLFIIYSKLQQIKDYIPRKKTTAEVLNRIYSKVRWITISILIMTGLLVFKASMV